MTLIGDIKNLLIENINKINVSDEITLNDIDKIISVLFKNVLSEIKI